MKIFVTGTRGIPGIQGGVETHCEELYPRLVNMGHDVTISCRKSYQNSHNTTNYKGVKLVYIPSIRQKSLEAFFHTFLSVIYARSESPDLIHIHAVGPSIMAPIARLLGLKVIVTNHGADYDRQKWGRFAKFILRTGEKLGTLYANQVIAISEPIRQTLSMKYKRNDINLIFNGVNKPEKARKTNFLDSSGIVPGKYLLAAGRFVPEKGFVDLIKAWEKLPGTKPQLVIAGDSDHETKYSREIKTLSKKHGVILTGFVKGEKLNQLFTFARMFIMPSYHEGLPIALLEALSYDLDVIVSDIPANKEIKLKASNFFAVGNIIALTQAMENKLNVPQKQNYSFLEKEYNWDLIASQTEYVYKYYYQNASMIAQR